MPPLVRRRTLLGLFAATALMPLVPRLRGRRRPLTSGPFSSPTSTRPTPSKPQLLAAIDAIRHDTTGGPVLTIINGDVFESGNAVASRSKGEADRAFLERLVAGGPVVLNIGNHEPRLDRTILRKSSPAPRSSASASSPTSSIPAPASPTPYVLWRSRPAAAAALAALATNAINTYPKAIRPLTIPDPVVWAKDNLPDS